MVVDPAIPLLRSYRPVRRVDATSAPWPGEVVRDPDGAAWLLVDAEELGDGWSGWHAAESEHLLTPRDLVRTPSGHAALFEVCAARLTELVTRRFEDRDPLSTGEALTVAVSVLRGHMEAAALSATSTGVWWLTDEGRPVLAMQTSGRADSPDILRLLATGFPAWAEVLGDVLGAMEQDRLHARDAQALEERLFALATPQPLRLAPRAGRATATAMDVATSTTGRPAATRSGTRAAARAAAAGDPRGVGWLTRISAVMDRDLADVVSRATTSLWRAAGPARPRSRRRTLLLAAGAAAIVLAVGLAWPTDTEQPAAAEQELAAPTPGATAAAGDEPGGAAVDTSASAPAAADASPDLAAVTEELLIARAACENDQGCLGAVVEDPTRALPAGASDLPPEARSVTFLDDLGGAAVLRVDAREAAEPAGGSSSSRASQLVVIVRIGETWVIRDIHDAGATP